MYDLSCPSLTVGDLASWSVAEQILTERRQEGVWATPKERDLLAVQENSFLQLLPHGLVVQCGSGLHLSSVSFSHGLMLG